MGLEKHQGDFTEELYHKIFNKLYHYAMKKLEDPSISEEAVQETFSIAWVKVDALMCSPNPEGWLMNTLKNVICNIKRDRSYLSMQLMSEEHINFLMAQGQENNLDPEFLYEGMVSQEEFFLLKRVAIDNRSMLEVAEELGITLEACKKRVQRAKAKFQKEYFQD